jgi:uncharacterized protein (DUF2461 family)
MKPTLKIDDTLFPPFSGFPIEALTFLKRLKKNNNRPWFQKRKQEYEEVVKFPMQCLVSSLASELSSEMPEIEFNPRRAVFRIYRDVRFSKNKAPYKTNIAAVPSGDQLKAIRNGIVSDADGFLAIVRDRKFRKEFGGLQGERLQKAPLGYPADHPMIEHLRYKQFFVGKELDERACLKPAFLRTVAASFRTGLPLVRWLAVVSETAATKRGLPR